LALRQSLPQLRTVGPIVFAWKQSKP